MAEKKPSKYSDRGAIGSAEELDAYGVWVKSEPQDLTAGMAEAVNFDAEAVPYADFDMEFDDSEESSFDFPGLEPEIPEISIESDEIASAESDDNDNFDDGIRAPYPGTTLGRGSEEASTQLLMKIADELSAIRSELSTLKKEFAGVRIESVSGAKTESRHGGFFDGEEGDDEKITLTGDEMENILTSANFSAEEDVGFDPQREADEAALKELSAQNESAADTEEEIEIDFDNLGINLDDDAEAGSQDEFPPLEAGADDELEAPSFDDALSSEEIPPLEELPSEELQEEIMPLEAFSEEDDEELQHLRREGASPLTPAPDNTVYLETDPFALDDVGLEDTSLEDTSLEETSLEDTSFAESGLTETAAPEETAPAETISQDTASEITEELSFDDGGLDLDAEEFSLDDIGEEQTDTGTVDISAEEKKSAEISIESPISLEEETSDEISLESPISLEEETSDEISLESPISLEEETSDEISLESPISLEEETGDEISLESPAPIEEEISGEQALDAESLDLSDAVIDEPDLSAGLVEAPLEEPVLGDISFGDDISLDMDDFGSGIDIDITDSGSADDLADSPVETPAVENLAIDDIDTNVELNAEEDISFAGGLTDDLVMDDVGTSVELDTGISGLVGDPADGLDLAADTAEPSVELDTGIGGLVGDPADGLDLAADTAEPSVELDTGVGGLIGSPADDLSLADDLAVDTAESSVELDTGVGGLVGDPADGLDLAVDTAEPSVELDTGDSGLVGDPADGLDLAVDTAEPSVELDTGVGGLVGDPADGLDLAVDTAEPSVELDTGDSGLADDPGLTDDLASDLALDDFDTAIDLADLPTALPDVEEDNGFTAGSVSSLADDDLTGVIPEGFEANAEEAPISVDDDLEAFDESELSLPETSATKTAAADADEDIDIPANFKSELKSVLSYMDRLLESLPEDKIEEFAKSEYFDSYKKIFKELGLV